MKILKPMDADACFEAPSTQRGSVDDLWGRNCRYGQSTAFYSLWSPSEEEKALIAAGHPVMVGVLNNGRPIYPIVAAVAARTDRIVDAPVAGEPGFGGLEEPTPKLEAPPQQLEAPPQQLDESPIPGIPNQRDAKGDEPFISSGEYTDPRDPAFNERG